MTTIDVAAYTNLYRFPTGRRLYAMSQVRGEAIGLGALVIANAAALAIDHDRHTQQLELRRRAAPRARYGPNAVRLDDELDRAVTGLDAYLDSQASLYGDADPRGRAARALRRTLLPDGPTAITRLSFVQEYEAVHALLARLDSLAAQAAALPELAAAADRLRTLNDRYGDALRDTRESPTGDEVRAARARGQELVARVFALVLAHAVQPGDEAGARAMLAPILEQNQAIGDARRRRSAARDVDPATGETLPDEPESGDGAGKGGAGADRAHLGAAL